ncbi:hypothetical protein NDU88_006164, partial [Pleurodeles waltl]
MLTSFPASRIILSECAMSHYGEEALETERVEQKNKYPHQKFTPSSCAHGLPAIAHAVTGPWIRDTNQRAMNQASSMGFVNTKSIGVSKSPRVVQWQKFNVMLEENTP